MYHVRNVLKIVSGAKAPDYDAGGLLLAAHSHDPDSKEIIEAYIVQMQSKALLCRNG